MPTPGEQAYAVAQQQLNCPYAYGRMGPCSLGFDCSGLMVFSYTYGPGAPNIIIGRSVQDIWNNNTNLTTVWNAQKQSGPIAASDLQVGDMLIYMQPGAPFNNQHVKMFAGGNSIIEAPAPGGHVQMGTVDFVGSSLEPFLGVKRVSGEAQTAGGNAVAGAAGTGTSGSSTANNQSYGGAIDAQTNGFVAARPDPPNNLPFSAFFQGQKVAGGVAGRSGSQEFTQQGVSGAIMPATTLVRGGMAELVANKFKCYFMMNPQTITNTYGFNLSQVSPLQLSPDAFVNGAYAVTNQTISFTIYFNRMYEVWQGNVHNPLGNGLPGPSDIGCRWDIRALERLVGVFDVTLDTGGTLGLGNYGAGGYPPSTLPLQIAFGGPNSWQFQGIIASLDYTYTIFDGNMIPVEAYADVEIMRTFTPQTTSADLVTPGAKGSLIQQTGQTGSIINTGPLQVVKKRSIPAGFNPKA